MKITTPEDFGLLLQRAVQLQEVSKYSGCRLVVRSKLPFINKTVELKCEELIGVWPDVRLVFDRISDLRREIIENNGLAILTQAFNDSKDNEAKPFWVFESGFTLHKDIIGIRHDTKTGLYYFSCRDGRFLEADIDAIAHNNSATAQFLVNVRSMLLRPTQVVDALNLCGVLDDKSSTSHVLSKGPASVLDIISISKTKLDTREVSYIYFDHTCQKPVAGLSNLKDFEERFPRITQALLAFNTMPFNADSTRAIMLREWLSQVEKIPTGEPVIFAHPTSLSYLLGLRSYSRNPTNGAVSCTVEKLRSVIISGDRLPSVCLSFGMNTRGQEVYQNFTKDNDQFVYLGLDKVLPMFETLDINGEDGALMLRAALQKHRAKPNQLDSLDSDTPLI